MIYDCFTFFNEFDLLEIRLNELNSVIDKFVLVEATKTFSGIDKPLNFQKNKHRFEKFLHKIIHVIVDEYPEINGDWVIENHQRNAILNGLKDCKDDDIVLISDCDEIPSPNAVLYNKDKPGLKIFEQTMYYYYLNLKASSKWISGTRMLFYKDLKNGFDNIDNYSKTVIKELNIGTTPQKVRHINEGLILKNAGWHFTYIGGVDMITKKVKAYSHFREVGKINEFKIEKDIRRGNARFNSDMFLIPVSIDKSFPEFVYKNMDKYKNYVLIQTTKEKIFCFINIIMKQPKHILKNLIYSTFGKDNLKIIEKKVKGLFKNNI